jgi:large subunit ribosomal protein L18
MRQTIYNVPFRRKREGKTNYKKRMKLLLANKPRLVVRPSLKNICAQIIDYNPKGDTVLVSASASKLKEYGWKYHTGNIPAAYLTGLMLGTEAVKKGIKEAILDIGLHSAIKGSRIFACLKGVVDSGIKVPHSKDVLPDDSRIKGEHIVKYSSQLKKDKESYEKKFSNYIKSNTDPEQLVSNFEEVKEKLKVK